MSLLKNKTTVIIYSFIYIFIIIFKVYILLLVEHFEVFERCFIIKYKSNLMCLWNFCKSPHCFFYYCCCCFRPYRSSTRSWWCSFAAGTRAQDVDLLFQEADFSNLIENNANFQNTHTHTHTHINERKRSTEDVPEWQKCTRKRKCKNQKQFHFQILQRRIERRKLKTVRIKQDQGNSANETRS